MRKASSERLFHLAQGHIAELKLKSMGRLGGSVVECLPSAQGVILGSWDQVLHWAPAGSLLLPLPISLLLSVCLSWINKIFLKILKIQFKNGQKIQKTFFQRRHTDSWQVHEKMLNIINHQIKTTIRYHFTSVRMAIIKRQEITSVGADVEKREH